MYRAMTLYTSYKKNLNPDHNIVDFEQINFFLIIKIGVNKIFRRPQKSKSGQKLTFTCAG